jgi:glycosyltransferase involved in cell wall biosynthesis
MKSKDIKLSIIIPRYSEDFALLKETLYSIQNQIGYDLSKVEVVIVDDSAGKYPLTIPEQDFTFNIQIVKCDENAGPGWARQIGVEKCNTNEFIYFLDADDLLEHDALYTFNEVLQQRNQQLDIVQFGGKSVGYDTNMQRYVIQPHFASTVWCHPGDYRVLTIDGWKRLDYCDERENILTCNGNGSNAGFEICYRITSKYEPELWKAQLGNGFKILANENHKLPVWRTDTYADGVDTVPMRLLKKDSVVVRSVSIQDQNDTRHLDFYKFLIAFQADGSRSSRHTVTFHFKKRKKIEEVKRLCRVLEFDWKSMYDFKSDSTRIIVNLKNDPDVSALLSKQHINIPLEELSRTDARELLDYLQLTDGHLRKDGTTLSFETTTEEAVWFFHALQVLAGYAGNKIGSRQRLLNAQTYYAIYGKNPKRSVVHDIETIPNDSELYCFNTLKGYFVVATPDGQTFVTHNCFGTFVRKTHLQKLGVKWNRWIRSNEEQIFMNPLFLKTNPQRIHSSQQPLIYDWRQTSQNTITRINGGEYGRTCVPEHTVGRFLVMRDLQASGKHQELQQMALHSIIHTYLAVQQSIFNDYPEWADNVNAIAGAIIRYFPEFYENLNMQDMYKLVNQQMPMLDQPLKENFEVWLTRVKAMPDPEYVLQPLELMDKRQNNGEYTPEYSRLGWAKVIN